MSTDTDADRLRRLQESIAARGIPQQWPRRRVELLLGSDREIGRERHTQELRVGITPEQCAALHSFTRKLDIELGILVVANAGARAGFSDHDYIHIGGAGIVALDELPYLDAAPDVVHGLKEPSRYEATIAPGFFCRIGALHSGDFDPKSGVAGLLQRGQVAVLDGSNIGSSETFRIPIRGRMSDFAGSIAAEWCTEQARARDLHGRAVVIGGGRVGRAAAARLGQDHRFTEVVIFESETNPDRLRQVTAEVAADATLRKSRVVGSHGLDDTRLVEAISGAIALVLGAAAKGRATPHVLTAAAVEKHLASAALVVDVSIDERGAIHDDGLTSNMNVADIIGFMERRFTNVRYRAGNNMPRKYPGPASQAHGEVILPYLGTLLYLTALLGGAEAVAPYLADRPLRVAAPDPWQESGAGLADGLIQDLRNGLALHHRDGRITVERCIADRAGLERFLATAALPALFL